MNYKIVNISTSARSSPDRSILIIYSGGTFGMVKDNSGALAPFNFGGVIEKIPELKNFELGITVISFPEPTDSSNIQSDHWVDMSYIIYENYHQYDGFVVLHGTDTMAYSASAVSFMLQGVNKPIIFTGAQLPIGAIRSDARENLLTSIELASLQEKKSGLPIIKEVGLYFNHFLFRGNRSQKIRSSAFAAFESENYPYLAQSGVSIEFNQLALRPHDGSSLRMFKRMDPNVAVLKLFPGITKNYLEGFFNIPKLKGVILETYGSGNTPSEKWFLDILKRANKKGIVLFNVSQCNGGRVIHGRYETSKRLEEIGVISGDDITTEAAIAKMMHLFGNFSGLNTIKQKLVESICGEMTGIS